MIWTVRGGDFGDGPGLSAAVERAVSEVVEEIVAELG